MGWIGDHSGHLGEEKLVRLVYLTFAGGSGGRWDGGGGGSEDICPTFPKTN